MERINHGTLYPDCQQMFNMIMLEWEIELWQFGKDKDSIISLHVIKRVTMLMWLRMLIIQMILKVFGHTFTIHTVQKRIMQLHLLSLEKVISNKWHIKSLIQLLNKLDLFWEVQMIRDIQHLMVFSLMFTLIVELEPMLIHCPILTNY